MTFDENILARNAEMDLGTDTLGTSLLPSGTILMEVKIPGAMPLKMAGFLSENNITKISYSKYGTYYTDYLMTDTKTERSVFYA